MGQITIDEMHKSLFDYAQAVSDENLMTESKTIVGAINEIYGKKLIANAIGEPLNSTDTYAKMNDDINGLLSTFKTNMMNSGVTVENGDKFKALIDKIKGLTENEGNKGVQYVEGTIESAESSTYVFTTVNGNTKSKNYAIIPKLPFEPIILILDVYDNISGRTWISILSYDSSLSMNTVKVGSFSENPETASSYHFKADDAILTNNYIRMPIWGNKDELTFKYYAFGVGEEDTTLRDSLASILQDEGVEVTPEDDMASLITKVDEEFDNRKQILVNALVNEGLNAKITNTYEELITMISLLKYVPANSIINGNSTDSDFINGLKSYSRNRGDADSKITYSVSNNTIIVEGSADCVETTNGQADEGKRDLYIYNPSYTVDVTDYDVFKVIASYSFYDMEYGCLEVGLYTGSDYKNPVKTIENGDLDITDLTGEYHIVINAFVWNEYYLGKTGILEGKVSYIGFE